MLKCLHIPFISEILWVSTGICTQVLTRLMVWTCRWVTTKSSFWITDYMHVYSSYKQMLWPDLGQTKNDAYLRSRPHPTKPPIMTNPTPPSPPLFSIGCGSKVDTNFQWKTLSFPNPPYFLLPLASKNAVLEFELSVREFIPSSKWYHSWFYQLEFIMKQTNGSLFCGRRDLNDHCKYNYTTASIFVSVGDNYRLLVCQVVLMRELIDNPCRTRAHWVMLNLRQIGVAIDHWAFVVWSITFCWKLPFLLIMKILISQPDFQGIFFS